MEKHIADLSNEQFENMKTYLNGDELMSLGWRVSRINKQHMDFNISKEVLQERDDYDNDKL